MLGRFFLSFCTLTLVACGSPKEMPAKPAIADFETPDAGTLQVESSSVSGQGRLIFSGPLQGINSKEHYLLEFQAPKDGSYLTLHSHFNGYNSQDGVDVKFQRDGQNLQISVSTPGYPSQVIYNWTDAFAESDTVRLRFEVHDGSTNGIDLYLWTDLISYQGEVRTRPDRVSVGNALYSSENEGKVFQSHGKGPFWGLTLDGVQLLSAQRESAYVQ